MRFKGHVALLMILSIAVAETSHGYTRHLRIELALGKSFPATAVIEDNRAHLQLQNATISGGNTSAQLFVGTDILSRVCVGLLVNLVDEVTLEGEVDDSIYIEEIGRAFLTDLRYMERYWGTGYFLTGRFTFARTEKSAFEIQLGLGRVEYSLGVFTYRSIPGAPVNMFGNCDRTASKWAGILQFNARLVASKGFALFARFGSTFAQQETFPEVVVEETINSPGEQIDYREYTLAEHQVKATNTFLIFGIEVSPF
jgi:hypothetical protein